MTSHEGVAATKRWVAAVDTTLVAVVEVTRRRVETVFPYIENNVYRVQQEVTEQYMAESSEQQHNFYDT